ncbi:MAG TPA: FxSxx-COOH system tetratricopeptide repeat protein [Actinoallomurus sp.]|nr:FxSxx-COOH system tetratricopeptide repeat protein [Actinoallomurus sp.]
MSLERFVNAIADAAPGVTPEEIADALWLATQLPASPPAGPEPAIGRRHPQERTGDIDRAHPAGGFAGHLVSPSRDTDAPRSGADLAAGMYAGHPDVTARHGILSPRVTALPGQREYMRAFRPLKRMVPSRRDLVLDEVATAELSAERGKWEPVLRGAPERWLSVALVVDDGPTMTIWRDAVAELRSLLNYTGAFADVREWRLNTDAPLGDRFLLRSDGPTDQTVERSPWELFDPEGRRLILVVSDGIGRAWRDRRVPRLLENWGRYGHVSIIQPLPQRLWRRCAPAITTARLHTPDPVTPNGRMNVRYRNAGDLGQGYRHRLGDEFPATGQGLPIPVLELNPRWLTRWAQIVAGGPDWNDMPVLFTGRGPNPRQQSPAELPAAERVRRFQANSSAEAFELAGYLAFAPLTPPVMRLVQEAMLPAPRTVQLAEVLLGGLLDPLRVSADPADGDRTVLYEFHAGVRELLRSTVRRSTALRVLDQVSGYVTARLGHTFDFVALLEAPRRDELARLAQLDRPFAVIMRSALRSLGGRYADIAEQLGEVLQPVLSPFTDKPLPVAVYPQARESSEYSSHNPMGGVVARSISGRPGRERQGSAPSVFIGVPPQNPYFTGREDLLRDIHERLTGKVTALVPHTLHGHGGVGKTHLAIEYVHRYKAEYDVVCWISAEQPALVRSGIAELAKQLGLPSVTVDEAVRSVIATLQHGQPYSRWLLVFDNANRPEDIEEFFPQGSGHILLTTRNEAWAGSAQIIEVDVFPREESIEFLTTRLGEEILAEAADALAQRLDDLPLALDQAAAWQAETRVSIDDYMRLFDERLTELVASEAVRGEVRPADYPIPVAVTWSLALDQLGDAEPQVVHLLQLCAFFAPEPIPWSLLAAGRAVPDLPRALRVSVGSPRELDRMIRTVKKYALAQVDYGSNRLQLHRLAQAVLREQLTPEERGRTRHQAHALIAAADPLDPDVLANWERYSELWPHVQPSGSVDCEHEEVRELVLNLTRYLYMQGGYDDGRKFAETTLERWREQFPPEDLRTLILVRHLATILRALGMVGEAHDLSNGSYEILLTLPPERESPEETLSTGNLIGATYRDLGRFEAALEMDKRLYAQHVEVFSESHPRTLMSANNLALDHFLVGDYNSARDLDYDTLQLRRRILGETKPFTLFSENNYARDLRESGEYWQARNLLEATFERYSSALGALHPDTLRTAKNLSVARRKVGDYEGARNLSEQAFAAYQNLLGPMHPDTLAAAANLVNDLRLTRDFDAALQLATNTLAGYRDSLGPDHPFTLATENNYAIVLRQAGRLADALEMSNHAFTGLRTALGPDHPYTLSAATTHGNDLLTAERHEEARVLLEETYAAFKQVLGRDHPYTLACAVNLVSVLRARGMDEDADQLAAVTRTRYEEVLGSDHPEVIAGRMAGVHGECSIESPAT